jgi:DNA-binding NtrC family response regulator
MALTTENTVSLNDLPGKFIAKKVEEQFDPKMFEGSLNFQEAEKTFETEMILKALKQCGFVQTKTAELLGISRRILKYKMDKLGITDRLDELTK